MEEPKIITYEEVLAIKKQYKIRISCFIIRNDGTLDVNGEVHISDTKLNKIPLKFGKIYGNFYCHNNELTTLENAPYFVDGDFNCYGNKLTSLEFGPKDVGGDYYCHENNLKTLKGSPKIINGSFNCMSNELTTLIDGPFRVNGAYFANNNELISLEGSPNYVGDSFHAAANFVNNLVGCPQEIGNIFSFDNTVSLYMGDQDCKVKEVIIQLQEKGPKSEYTLPQTILDNQKHLPAVFKYMHAFQDIFSADGTINETNFNELIDEIENGMG